MLVGEWEMGNIGLNQKHTAHPASVKPLVVMHLVLYAIMWPSGTLRKLFWVATEVWVLYGFCMIPCKTWWCLAWYAPRLVCYCFLKITIG
jgi:hypothetical protein